MNLRGLVGKILDYKMDYGIAFHKGMAHWLKTGYRVEATKLAVRHMFVSKSQLPEDDYLNAAHLMNGLEGYFDRYANDDFTVAKVGEECGVELSFAYPFKAYETVDVILCGVVDSVGFWNGKRKVFKDIKTTAAYFNDRYFASYELSVQMMLYSWIIRKLGWTDYYPPCIIDGVFISKSGTKYQRSQLIDYREDLIDELMKWIEERCDEIVDRIEGRREWRRNFSRCQTQFGQCQYHRVCSVKQEFKDGLIDMTFDKRTYDPSKFGE